MALKEGDKWPFMWQVVSDFYYIEWIDFYISLMKPNPALSEPDAVYALVLYHIYSVKIVHIH